MGTTVAASVYEPRLTLPANGSIPIGPFSIGGTTEFSTSTNSHGATQTISAPKVTIQYDGWSPVIAPTNQGAFQADVFVAFTPGQHNISLSATYQDVGGIGPGPGTFTANYVVSARDWKNKGPTQMGETATGPAAVEFNGRLYIVWKGQGGDQQLYWSSSDGTSWTAQALFPGGTTDRPALAVHNERLYAAWKGMLTNGVDDPAIHWASSDGTTWVNGGAIPESTTDIGPTISDLNGSLYCIWKDATNQEQPMAWAVLD